MYCLSRSEISQRIEKIKISTFIFLFSVNSLTRVSLTITNILELSIWRLRLKQSHVQVQQTQRSEQRVFITTLLPLPAKFRFVEILPMRILTLAKFRRHEFSLQWMWNFAKITAKFRLTQRKFVSTLTKFRAEVFARTKNEKHRISFAFLLHSTVCSAVRWVCGMWMASCEGPIVTVEFMEFQV